ncbi:unnamed protein product [Heligmosomoides polygyrus]|uniref:Uncharacterized protein n=1 Tax=Heligmosomoides polygyrus TaxID=6339 RepID=A0A183GSI0_HELPZ|nr:unnamed protein product [Heligmosomoides polygyrus]
MSECVGWSAMVACRGYCSPTRRSPQSLHNRQNRGQLLKKAQQKNDLGRSHFPASGDGVDATYATGKVPLVFMEHNVKISAVLL